MAATTPSSRSVERARAAGALWVAGTGAFLLLAAAAVFVAVRWEQIPASAKFAAIVALTGACVTAGRRLRTGLPATAAALFHLGVLLVPIDVAAIGVRLGWTWPVMLLAQGAAASVVFPVAARAEDSTVLRAAAWTGVVFLAAGVGGTTPVPAAVVLALVALVAAGAVQDPKRLPAGSGIAVPAWATVAGLAPALAGAERLGLPGGGVLADLGMAGDPSRYGALTAGAIAGATLALTGQRRRSVPCALLGIASLVTGAATSWLALEPTGTSTLIALAAVAVVVESVAWWLRADPFWGPLARPAAAAVELGAALFALELAGSLFDSATEPVHAPQPAVAAALAAIAWLIGGVRRTGRLAAWPVGLIGAAVSASGAVALATGSPGATAAALCAGGSALALLAPRAMPKTLGGIEPGGMSGIAVAMVAWAPLVAHPEAPVAAAVAVAGALAVAESAVRVTRAGRGPAAATASHVTWLVVGALAPLAGGLAVVALDGRPGPALVGAVLALWLVAAVADQADVPSRPTPVAAIPRVAAVSLLAATPALPASHATLLAATIAVLAVVDALRLDEPPVALGASLAAPVALAELAVATGWSTPEAGVILTVSAAVWLGLGAVLPARWTPPLAAGAAVSGGLGMLLALGDPTAGANAAIVAGGLMAALGLGLGQRTVTSAGGILATLGMWEHLRQAEVSALEPYAAPVALLLVAAGWIGRREGQTSSWVAYTPAIGLLGGGALGERVAGGAGWHALVAGGVATVAVAVGGARRLAGPLLAGTLLLGALVVNETLSMTAGAPTWMWLAAGGTTLLVSGVLMERRGIGPVEGGRRLVDIVRESFV
jgi:hypothetical protein